MTTKTDSIGVPYGLRGKAQKFGPKGIHATNERDERGVPIGTTTFNGGNS